MSDTLGITNPYLMNGLGSYGLGGFSSYGNYGDPYMMGMGMMTGTGTLGMSPYGMMGMGMMGMDPNYMTQIYKNQAQAQMDIQKMQLEHTGAMNQLLLQSEIQANAANNEATFQKAMSEGDIDLCIDTIAQKVREKDTDGICKAFNDAREAVYRKYADYFNKNAKNTDPKKAAGEWVEMRYANKMKSMGIETNLIADIEANCDGALAQGFWANFKGKDYHQRDKAETIAFIRGTAVDNASGKEIAKKIGAVSESVVETVLSPIAGYAAGGALALTAGGVAKGILSTFGKSHWINLKTLGKWGGGIGAVGLLASDLIWQIARKTNSTNKTKNDNTRTKQSSLASPILFGAAGGAGGLAIGKLAKLTSKNVSVGKSTSIGTGIGAAFGLIGDLIWQSTNN